MGRQRSFGHRRNSNHLWRRAFPQPHSQGRCRGPMTLCGSPDTLGPMTRPWEDALRVLPAISGPDAGDISTVPSGLDFDSGPAIKGLPAGFFPPWMKEDPATDVDRAALDPLPK